MQFLDVAGISTLEITISPQNEIWINAPSGCIFRGKMIKEIIINDERVEKKISANSITYETTAPERDKQAPVTHTFKD